MNPRELASFFDHTLLKPEATAGDVRRLCGEAVEHGFFAVCVNPTYVKLCVSVLKETPVKVCTVAGFPLGAHLKRVKAAEALRAIVQGAREIDMVMNVGALKDGEHGVVADEIETVAGVCSREDAICKVIVETALLTRDEKVAACRLAVDGGAHFVKTSTGFARGGATVQDVRLMVEAVGKDGVLVKASGGVRTLADATSLIEAGAARLGASGSVNIMEEARKQKPG